MKDYFGYSGLTCVVTGAASGMGKDTTQMLVEMGADVYALDLNECTVTGIKKFVSVDLGSKDSIDAAFAGLPAVIHKFFGIAGVSGAKHSFNQVYTINFIANKYITEQYLLERMPDGPVGAIAYMSSQAGARWHKWQHEYKDIALADSWEDAVSRLEAKGCTAGLGGYQMSKRSLTYYTKYMAATLGPRSLRVNCVCPCNTVTGLIDEFRAYSGSFEASKALWGAIQREATAQEMANAIVFLNSDMAVMVSGTDFAVDGASISTIDVGLRETNLFNGSCLGLHELPD